jgi:uncharacterized protein involved in exopolysaccharide biosynthesis
MAKMSIEDTNPDPTTPRETAEGQPQIEAEFLRAARARRWAKVRLLWDERRFLFRAMVAGAILFTLAAFLLPKYYESTTRLMPPSHESSITQTLLSAVTSGGAGGGGGNGGGGGSAALGSVAGELLGGQGNGDLFIGVLSSKTVQDRIIDEFNLKAVYGKKLYEDAEKKLKANTEISQDRKSGIIGITVTDRDPMRAAGISGAYVTQLNRAMTEVNTSAAHRERIFLDGRLTEVKKDLESAEQEFSQYSSKSGAIDITEQGKAMVQAAAMLQGEYIAAESQLQGLKQIYTSNNVRVRAAEARVGELSRQLEKMSGKLPEAENGTASADENSSLYPSIRELPLLGVKYSDLFRRLKVQEAVFEVLTKEDELAKAQEAKETPSVSVLDPASMPEGISSPARLRLIVLGPLAALLLGIIFLLVRDFWNGIDPADPGKRMLMEIYGTTHAWIQRLVAKKGLSSSPTEANGGPAA